MKLSYHITARITTKISQDAEESPWSQRSLVFYSPIHFPGSPSLILTWQTLFFTFMSFCECCESGIIQIACSFTRSIILTVYSPQSHLAHCLHQQLPQFPIVSHGIDAPLCFSYSVHLKTLGCFWVLTIMNNATTNICNKLLFLWIKCQRVSSLMLSLVKNYVFPVPAPLYISIRTAWVM